MEDSFTLDNGMTKKLWLTVLLIFSSFFAGAEAAQQDVPTDKENTVSATDNDPLLNHSKETTILKLNGFGTFGALNTSQTQGDYVLDSFMAEGAGKSNSVDISNYSKFGVQVNALFTPEISGQMQVVSGYMADNSFQPEVEWFNVKYAVKRDLAVRLGRVELPTFMDSDNHDVGYSYAWAHLPIELYHLLSIQTSDGLDATYRSEIGNVRNSIKYLIGQNVSDRPTTITTSKNMWGLFDSYEYNQITFSLGYQKRNSITQNKATGLSNGWYESSDLSVGINYDSGDWFVMSEWLQSHTRYNSNAMYAGGGYRISKFTPFFIHSQNNVGSFGEGATPSVATVSRANRAQKTDSVGVRWDFKKNYDFKFQYDRVTLSDNSNGFLINAPSTSSLYGNTFYALSAVLDFVF